MTGIKVIIILVIVGIAFFTIGSFGQYVLGLLLIASFVIGVAGQNDLSNGLGKLFAFIVLMAVVFLIVSRGSGIIEALRNKVITM